MTGCPHPRNRSRCALPRKGPVEAQEHKHDGNLVRHADHPPQIITDAAVPKPWETFSLRPGATAFRSRHVNDDPTPEGWVHLGPRVRNDTLAQMDAALPRSLRETMIDAGLQFRRSRTEDRVLVRGDFSTGAFFYLLPLQNADGTLRSDAESRLDRYGVDLDLDVLTLMEQQPGFDSEWQPTAWTRLFLELIDADSPLEVLRTWLAQDEQLRFFRLVTTPRLAGRRIFLRYFDDILEGADPSVVPAGDARRATARTEGLWEVGGAPLLAPILLARYQPAAAVLTTARGAQVAVTRTEGHLVRPFVWDSWPVGLNKLRLEGSGRGVYRADVEHPAGWASDLIALAVDAGDRFLREMTDPARWRNQNGRYDHRMRQVTWASVIHGLHAILDMAEDWTGHHSLWDAFRALGSLQSIWEGDAQGSVGLTPLLDPRTVREYATSNFPNDVHRQWAEAIVGNYERAILALSPQGDLHDAVERLTEIRHLLHGVQSQGGRRKMLRFEVLEHADQTEPDIQLVRDIAAFWWSAVIFEPGRNCRPGSTPWR